METEEILLIGMFFLFGCLLLGFAILIISEMNKPYTYVGRITDMEGGSSSNVLILNIDTIGKTPYRFISNCVDKIRIGQEVYKHNDILLVAYEPGQYC